MITTYSSYIQRLDSESLKQYVPSGETLLSVVLKEILDNALDACEKNGDNTVIVKYLSDNFIDIANNGKMPNQVLKDLKRPDNNTSEKFKQYSYKRGAIGQGLKLAVAMATDFNNYFSIETGNLKYSISIVNRNPKKPADALDIKTFNRLNDGFVHIIFACPKEKITQMLHLYMITNPHITFVIDDRLYKRTCDIKKNFKNDISKYYLTEDLPKLLNFYKLPEIVDSFNVPVCLKNKIKDVRDLKEYAKPVKPAAFGEDALKKRLKAIHDNADILAYKKINADEGIIELAVLSYHHIFVSINESPLNEFRLFITEPHNKKIDSGLTMSLSSFLSHIKFNNGLIVIYHNSRPNYNDANKQSILIEPDEKEFNKIKNFLKQYSSSKRTERDGWHLCDSRDEFIDRIIATANEMYNFMNLQITVRQLYYQLVSNGSLVNGNYDNLSRLVTKLRKTGQLDWRIFDDRNREIYEPDIIDPDVDIKEFFRNYIENLSIPDVNKWHCQKYYIELWYEKDALYNHFKYISDKLQIISYATRGYNSLTKNNEAIERLKLHKDKKIVVLYCGDLDPTGIMIYENLKREIQNVEIKRIALTAEQVEKYNLIEMPVMKGRDTTIEKFKSENGDKAYELDALPPEELIKILDNAIAEYYDNQIYDNLKRIENERLFDDIKMRLLNSVNGNLKVHHIGRVKIHQ